LPIWSRLRLLNSSKLDGWTVTASGFLSVTEPIKQQLQQLGDIRRNPPRLIFRAYPAPPLDQLLTISVGHDELQLKRMARH
jgi:hypothetical protein